ncbi:extensin family protein [Leucothrix pacifica]|uniref:Extensin n=1 Tax=Leucothrix pacifica TaxID=1247513 RepID=A0A317C8W9_9GAMM|nr:extensin family protein [Leucothrix pacifica]PWQ95115.1 extensin [Leucothrix pacifica]
MALRNSAKTLIYLLFMGLVTVFVHQLLIHPNTPLPRAWNPTKPLLISDYATAITPFKLTGAVAQKSSCLTALGTGSVRFTALSDLEVSDNCGIENRVKLSRVGSAALSPVETSCPVTLRTAMWEQYSLQPAAKAHLGAGIKEILHYSSYNCRRIRGSSNRWSTHASGEAIDVAGFVLTDGRTITLLKDWDKEPDFFNAIKQGACQWFKTVLGPDYNRLHRDHFHLQSVGRGTCR